METKKKKVLIALDYNPTAQKVAEAGYAMAKAMHAEVFLLHIVAEPVYYSSPEFSPIMGFTGYNSPAMLELTSEELKKASHHFLDKSKQHLGDSSIKTIVEEGDFAETILSTAKTNHVDLIVLGSHSRRWLDEVLMGSVTEKVLHHTTTPLLIIPTRQKK